MHARRVGVQWCSTKFGETVLILRKGWILPFPVYAMQLIWTSSAYMWLSMKMVSTPPHPWARKTLQVCFAECTVTNTLRAQLSP